ncbi:MAG TPA: family 16 glycoside hydrolase [Pirellulales bacterium]|jgi:hypothetical protein|nr:family 16 glycoside hydrolase [Pirellulales bacterium]
MGIGCVAAARADEPATQLARPGKLLFADDFARADAGEAWTGSLRSFRIEDGALVVSQREDATHPAVVRTTVEFKDAVLTFRFRFDGAPRFGVVFNDKNHADSHAGHICRVSVSPNQISVGDDKEGAMKHGIYEKWQHADTKEEVRSIVESTQIKAPVKIESKRWYSMTVEIVGDEMAVSLDGKPITRFKSSGFDHAVKNHWGFTVSGQSIDFDDVKLWSVER